MNEKIRELAEQVGIAVFGDAVYMFNPEDTLDSTVIEKFANLILEECAARAEVYAHMSPNFNALAEEIRGMKS
jgi:hypothetical protein